MSTKKKKKYNARFPPARIKKIMQSDEEVGKVAAAVPVIISRALELFVETLLRRMDATMSERGARTMTPSHLKLCIYSEPRFDFLKDLVGEVADLQADGGPPSADSSPAHQASPSGPGGESGRCESNGQRPPRLPRQISTSKQRGRARKASTDVGTVSRRQSQSKKLRLVDWQDHPPSDPEDTLISDEETDSIPTRSLPASPGHPPQDTEPPGFVRSLSCAPSNGCRSSESDLPAYTLSYPTVSIQPPRTGGENGSATPAQPGPTVSQYSGPDKMALDLTSHKSAWPTQPIPTISTGGSECPDDEDYDA
eukprot:maker-scaffold269_size230758-snap-gene-0.18 protein:Tk07985 transcript:maker-scaffold269_size230758-snap-gene-0.18-mRNA-1 annotation:"dr1-associated corepressor isoform x1"